MAMTLDAVRELVQVEYSLVEVGVALDGVSDALARLRLPGARLEARRLAKLAGEVRAVLARLDGPINDAAREFEEYVSDLPF